MSRKPQNEGNEGGLFPVRFDIEKESENQTKKVQGLFQAHGNTMNLLEVRKKIYERGLRTFESELKKLDRIKAEV
jgi:hypothetical protein